MSLITVAQLARVAPHAAARIVAALVDHADEVLPRYGLATAERLPDFMAHVLVESAYLARVDENLNYSAERLHEVWPKRFPTVASAEPFARNPRALANKVYGRRMGNTGPDDGWLNRGQGALQTTGHTNIARLAAYLGVSFETARAMLTSDAGMLEAAAATYCLLGAPAFADRGDIIGSTRAINGGLNGLADRRAALALCRKVWPRVPLAAATRSAPKPAPVRPAAPVIPPQTKEATVPAARMPVFLAAILGLFGLSPAQAAPLGAGPALHTGLLAGVLVMGILVMLAAHRALPRLRVGQALKLAAVFLLLGAGAAHAGTVDFSPLAQAAINDFAVPVLMAVAPTVAAILVMPLKRFLDQRSALDLATRVNDLLDKGIASGARVANAKWAAGTLDVDVDGVVATAAAAYANGHAPQLMRRATGAVGPALDKLLREKVEARLDSHPDHLALKGAIAAAGAPVQLAGAA